MEKKINVALLGFGVVGSGTAEVLIKNRELIKKRTNKDINIKYILVKPGEIIPSMIDDKPIMAEVLNDYDKIANDKEVSIVIECIGGLEAAYNFTKRALCTGKHVVTSNKELVAARGTELLKIAKDNNVRYLFDASVLGAIPGVINLRQTLVANEINSISGIVNGTTNFILTEMRTKKKSYEEALKEAQKLGYAEKNPDDDVLGKDAARKICILASTAYGMEIREDMILTEGITKITKEDIEVAQELHCKIKLIATIDRTAEDKIRAMVAPRLVRESDSLANVEGIENILTVDCDMAGNISFIGKGAGKLTTASAVVADVLNILNLAPIDMPIEWTKREVLKVEAPQDIKSKYFIRVKCPFVQCLPLMIRELACIFNLNGNALFYDVQKNEKGFSDDSEESKNPNAMQFYKYNGISYDFAKLIEEKQLVFLIETNDETVDGINKKIAKVQERCKGSEVITKLMRYK